MRKPHGAAAVDNGDSRRFLMTSRKMSSKCGFQYANFTLVNAVDSNVIRFFLQPYTKRESKLFRGGQPRHVPSINIGLPPMGWGNIVENERDAFIAAFAKDLDNELAPPDPNAPRRNPHFHWPFTEMLMDVKDDANKGPIRLFLEIDAHVNPDQNAWLKANHEDYSWIKRVCDIIFEVAVECGIPAEMCECNILVPHLDNLLGGRHVYEKHPNNLFFGYHVIFPLIHLRLHDIVRLREIIVRVLSSKFQDAFGIDSRSTSWEDILDAGPYHSRGSMRFPGAAKYKSVPKSDREENCVECGGKCKGLHESRARYFPVFRYDMSRTQNLFLDQYTPSTLMVNVMAKCTIRNHVREDTVCMTFFPDVRIYGSLPDPVQTGKRKKKDDGTHVPGENSKNELMTGNHSSILGAISRLVQIFATDKTYRTIEDIKADPLGVSPCVMGVKPWLDLQLSYYKLFRSMGKGRNPNNRCYVTLYVNVRNGKGNNFCMKKEQYHTSNSIFFRIPLPDIDYDPEVKKYWHNKKAFIHQGCYSKKADECLHRPPRMFVFDACHMYYIWREVSNMADTETKKLIRDRIEFLREFSEQVENKVIRGESPRDEACEHRRKKIRHFKE
jgi:hypothetical protein